ncbi:hypothetical protein H0A36_27890 [Endozoicomonas sp. SM1973]|uniref:Uncharacterized protein n=1 Tax=Spartinivicinus marinus TaxID=2994442 RepID=A0A853IH46_9GAMM|nr:hypothetical protein [Spartinivicinus marinus]MCX4026437.1 hypothetical protein [Spartinivicinus marinus]NYZ69838.1 hypothetical protein [Spartinivicinus marinus]
MANLLLFINGGLAFDKQDAITVISNLKGTINTKEGQMIGAVFECVYKAFGRKTIIRLSDNLETISCSSTGDEALTFALELTKTLGLPLRAIDSDYSFDIELAEINTLAEFKKAIELENN